MPEDQAPLLRHRFIEAFGTDDGFCFAGAHCYGVGGRSLLVSGESGGCIMLDDGLLDGIVNRNPSGDLKFKLVQRGLGRIHRSRPVPDGPEPALPSFFMGPFFASRQQMSNMRRNRSRRPL